MHIMIDLETIATSSRAAFLQFSAVPFEAKKDGEIYVDKRFNTYIGDLVGETNMDTFHWWLGQDPAAIAQLRDGIANGIPQKQACLNFLEWYNKLGKVEGVWSHGASFDIPIVQTAFERYGLKFPCPYWNHRDTRTLFWMKNFNLKTIFREGTHHNAVDDCIHQIKGVQACL